VICKGCFKKFYVNNSFPIILRVLKNPQKWGFYRWFLEILATFFILHIFSSLRTSNIPIWGPRKKSKKIIFQTGFHGDSKKKHRLYTSDFFFDQIRLLQKMSLNLNLHFTVSVIYYILLRRAYFFNDKKI